MTGMGLGGRVTCKSIALIVVAGYASMAVGETLKVVLKDGQEYDVETADGLPVRFADDRIAVQDVGITARFALEQGDSPPYVWILLAELAEQGSFTISVTTPLDPAASAILEVKGPGPVRQPFFAQSEFPTVWEGIDEPGVHWFPFHFVFEDKELQKRFEFTQWAQMDDGTWKEVRTQVEKAQQQFRRRR